MALVGWGILPALADDFYSIRKIDINPKESADGTGIWAQVKNPDTGKRESHFVPSVEVQVATRETTPSNGMIARAYFYDSDKKLLGVGNVTNAVHIANETAYALPPEFGKDQVVSLYFPLPQNLPSGGCTALVVFGDNMQAVAKVYPTNSSAYGLDYPEKSIVEGQFSSGEKFYNVEHLKVLTEAPPDGTGVWFNGKDATTQKKVQQYIPSLEVQMQTKNDSNLKDVFTHVYFFDADKKLLATVKTPARAVHEQNESPYVYPQAFPRNQIVNEYFSLPKNLPDKGWTAVVVFGDKVRAVAKVYPNEASEEGLDYPERGLVNPPSVAARDTRPHVDIFKRKILEPLNECVVKTDNPDHPELTLFLRPPPGVTDGTKIKGVIALCMLEKTPDDVKRELQGLKVTWETTDIMDFATKHQLAIIAWNMVTVWDPKLSYNEMDLVTQKTYDTTFDEMAKAWEKGVDQLSRDYGIPRDNYLLWGVSGAAQYACRLALRKPDYFLAIHADIPSSFDKPTLQANKVLWLLTTGEEEGGYLSAEHFYQNCRSLGYPIIFKALPNQGHRSDPTTQNLGHAFFEYALSLQDEKKATLAKIEDSGGMVVRPWPKTFQAPEYVGDIVNQDCYAATYAQVISPAFRVPLPTKALADAWRN